MLNREVRSVVLVALAALLAACASSRVLDEWPETVPEQNWFIQAYQADEANQQRQTDVEYLTWVVRFYEGWELMATGWNDITPALMVDMEGEQRRELAARSEQLGKMISAEWAKDNDVRSIDTSMLSLWGSVMLAVEQPHAKLAAVTLIDQDVDALLRGELSAEEVNDQRYMQRLDLPADF